MLSANENIVTEITPAESGCATIVFVLEVSSQRESTPMKAAFEYLSHITEEFFEAQMRRAARKITERQHLFSRRTV